MKMISFTKLLHDTFSLLEKHFLEFLFAVAFPLIIFFMFIWSIVAMFTADINAVTNYQELLQTFSLSNGTTVFALLSLILISFVNIVGFIAAPLVAVQHDTIAIRKIFPTAMKYFSSGLMMIIMMSIIYFLLLIIGYVFVTVLLTIIAFINVDIVPNVQTVLTNVIPSGLVLLATFSFTFAPYILVDKNPGAWNAIIESIGLVKKHFWPLLFRMAILILLLSVVLFIIQFIPLIGSPLATILGAIIITAYNYILYREVTQN